MARAKPNTSEMLAVMRHLADVAALKGDPPAQRQLLIDGLNELVGTDSGFFYLADQWRAGKPARFSHCTLARSSDPAFVRHTADFGIQFTLDDDPFCFRSLRDDAAQGTFTFADALGDGGGGEGRRYARFMDLAVSVRYRDGVISYFRTGAGGDRVVGVGLHRVAVGGRLDARRVRLTSFAVDEIRWLVTRGHLVLPPVEAASELPPRLRQTFDRLLAGRSPKAIARELGLSIWTVREHIQRLYHHVGVSGREELMARFVGAAERGGSAAGRAG